MEQLSYSVNKDDEDQILIWRGQEPYGHFLFHRTLDKWCYVGLPKPLIEALSEEILTMHKHLNSTHPTPDVVTMEIQQMTRGEFENVAQAQAQEADIVRRARERLRDQGESMMFSSRRGGSCNAYVIDDQNDRIMTVRGDLECEIGDTIVDATGVTRGVVVQKLARASGIMDLRYEPQYQGSETPYIVFEVRESPMEQFLKTVETYIKAVNVRMKDEGSTTWPVLESAGGHLQTNINEIRSMLAEVEDGPFDDANNRLEIHGTLSNLIRSIRLVKDTGKVTEEQFKEMFGG